MANDQIYNYIEDFIAGVITREQFWILAKFKYPTHQICFATEASLKCLKFVESEKHNDLFYLCALIEYIARATTSPA